MKYQLVLQFSADSLADYDAMIILENKLIQELGDSADVDGHDCGAGETNIFIHTADPISTFWKVRQTLQEEGCLESVRAAYRDIQGEEYTLIWPEGDLKDFRVT